MADDPFIYDVQIDTYSNEAEASIRVTHLPTGTVVSRPVEKGESRISAREIALAELRAAVLGGRSET